MKSIILAGGSGTRLWPLSREHYPKQFLKIGDYSLFQQTFLRCCEVSNVSEIFVVTNKDQKFYVIGQINELGYDFPKENVLIEPEGKNTLPAICFGMKEIRNLFGPSNVGIFSSDHVLDSGAMQTISDAESLADDGYLLTFGIQPTSPNTGYGYIKPAESLSIGMRVSEFREKPDEETACKYIEEGCLWNSGMFLFNTETFFSELAMATPEIYESFEQNEDINQVYTEIPSISVDYGTMEKSQKVAVVPLQYKWSDLGNFAALYDELDKDSDDNVVYDCELLPLDSQKNLVHSRTGKLVSLIDVNDMVVVDTPDALLISPKESSQKVKQIVNQLKERGDPRAKIGQTVYRPWGSYTVLESSDNHVIKKIMVMPEQKLSLQLHYHRSEHWVVVTGMAEVHVNGDDYFVRPGESTFIRAGERHRLGNPSRIPLEIIEVQLGEYVAEDDIVRFDDVYGRK
jgi:mannose-1-phosphate guanylyltransferase/mannose-6-phosphate isomerase